MHLHSCPCQDRISSDPTAEDCQQHGVALLAGYCAWHLKYPNRLKGFSAEGQNVLDSRPEVLAATEHEQ